MRTTTIKRFEKIKNRLNEFGYNFIDENIFQIYSNVNEKYSLIDENGYKYYCCLKHIFRGSNPNFVGTANPYSIENINLWITKNNKSFTLLSKEYVNADSYLQFKCNNGHYFERTWSKIKCGNGCRKCRYKKQSILQMKPRSGGRYLSNDDKIALDWDDNNEFQITHYSFKSGLIVHWKCHICGYKWDTSICHRTKDKSGCPKCSNVMSKSEKYIANFLLKNEIEFVQEYCFTDCRDVNPLPFDFYLPKHNTCIEYDGEQHFHPVCFSSSKKYDAQSVFEYTQRHDKIKTEYCNDNNIVLYRISYKDNIDAQLNKIVSLIA